MGLSVKWATCNLGASTMYEYGTYFAWGELFTKYEYNFDSYKWCTFTNKWLLMTKYCTNSNLGYYDGKGMLELADDAADVRLGGSWRIPTKAEFEKLMDRNNCFWTWITVEGVNGYIVVSKKNGKSIFLPAAGGHGNEPYHVGSNGYYWSSTLDGAYRAMAYGIHFYKAEIRTMSSGCYSGYTIRLVTE